MKKLEIKTKGKINKGSRNIWLCCLIAIVQISTYIAFTLVTSHPVNAANFPVSNVAELIDAITAANDETTNPGLDTIIMASGTYQLSQRLPSVTSIIKFIGNGSIIDGGQCTGCGPIFRVWVNGELTISNLTVSNGNTSDTLLGVGGIDNGGIVKIENSTVNKNFVEEGTGGIINRYGSTMTLINCTVEGNYNCGYVAVGCSGDGAGGIKNKGDLTVINSTVSNNHSSGRSGGIINSGTLTILNSAISNNRGHGGGGIANSGLLTLTNSTVSFNVACERGGGIANTGTATAILTNSTISNNLCERQKIGYFPLCIGGGISNSSDGTLKLINSTIKGNKAGSYDPTRGVYVGLGGGISGEAELVNTIVADNIVVKSNPNPAPPLIPLAVTETENCLNPITSLGHNLEDKNDCGLTEEGDQIHTDPKLTPLQYNGGPTQTHMPWPGNPNNPEIDPPSPAIDAGDDKNCPPTDQRGVPRLGICDIGACEFGAPADGYFRITDLIGDKDDFHSGDVEDTPLQSQIVRDLIASRAPEDKDVNLDVDGVNRPVGLTHYFYIPEHALVTSANVEFRFKGSEHVHNDGILYKEPIFPAILLMDLLGFEPQDNETYTVSIDLANVPVRTGGDPGAGGYYTGDPDEYRNLFPELQDGQFDMVFVDDITLDFSELTIEYTLPLEGGDLNGDGSVDRDDLSITLADIRGPAPHDPSYDLNGDGKVNIADARYLVTLFTNPGGAPYNGFWSTTLVAGQAQAITLSLDPSCQTIYPGDSIFLDLNISGLTEDSLGAFDLDITFDASVLTFDSVVFGPLLGDPTVVDTSVTSTAGVVGLDEVSLLPAGELDVLQGESFTLASLTFLGSNLGSSALGLSNVVLSDAFGYQLPDPALQSADIDVVPEPSTIILVVVGFGLAGVIAFVRKKKYRMVHFHTKHWLIIVTLSFIPVVSSAEPTIDNYWETKNSFGVVISDNWVTDDGDWESPCEGDWWRWEISVDEKVDHSWIPFHSIYNDSLVIWFKAKHLIYGLEGGPEFYAIIEVNADDYYTGQFRKTVSEQKSHSPDWCPWWEKFQDDFDAEVVFNTQYKWPFDDRITSYTISLFGTHRPSIMELNATASGNTTPQIGALGTIVQNGDFNITDQGPTRSFNPQNIGAGDGVDETTTWIFDFTTDPLFDVFSSSVPSTISLAYADLILTLTPKHSLISNDIVRMDLLSDINDTKIQGLTKNITCTLKLDLLDFYSSDDILGVFSGYGGKIPMLYADDAIVSGAQLTLQPGQPVPEPSTLLLLGSGLIGVLALRRRGFRK